jgi:hypothetical protein
MHGQHNIKFEKKLVTVIIIIDALHLGLNYYYGGFNLNSGTI